ncbi:MAG: cold shock domain-containing protein [Candidatus Tectomicrobia bacterium]|nr:cold shock domain-containing protein [Candidatus Tectomicrobia bacterium]
MNRPFIHGINFEERLRTKLEALGCRIYYDQTYDHQYKLDFIVNGFRDVVRLPEHIGMQITANKDDVTKQREFVYVQKKNIIVPKAVYLEADPVADIEQGAATLVYAALLTLVFNRAYRYRRVVGLRLTRNFSFEFFDLEENIRRLLEVDKTVKPQRAVTLSEELLVGKIINFNKEKGYGFIECESRPNNVFFHIRNDVADDVLTRIESVQEESTGWRQLDIPVSFREKSVIRFGEDKPAAFDIKLSA